MNLIRMGMVLLSFCTVVLLPIGASAQTEGSAQGYEHILSYKSDITVHEDRTLDVTEDIVVYADGTSIQHGIYRDFPTSYTDTLGNTYRVAFTLNDVRKFGAPVSYHIEDQSNGIRIYIGDANVFLSPGVYSYRISYSVTRELGFFKDHDELYWNVTGNGWQYAIDSAEANVHLPSSIPLTEVTTNGYTGPFGSKEEAYTASVTPNGVTFAATRPLEGGEGLTLVVGWPKGYLKPPTEAEMLWDFISDHMNTLVSLAGLLLVSLYYLYAWYLVGRDPKRGTVMPEYDPPENLSPAVLRFLTRMHSDQRTMAAAILSLANKGALTIEGSDNNKYVLNKKSNGTGLSNEENEVMQTLFSAGLTTTVVTDNANHARFQTTELAMKNKLEQEYGTGYFALHAKFLIGGIALSVAPLAYLFFKMPVDAAFSMLFSLAAGAIVISVFWQLTAALWNNRGHAFRGTSVVSAIVVIIVLTGFLAPLAIETIFDISASEFRGAIISLWILFMCLFAINRLFAFLLHQRTPSGRALQDKIEGFKWFLSVTEQERMNFRNPPDKTPELFERFLPYALALDVENEWAEQFATVFAGLEENGHPYTPTWYAGSSFGSTPTAFASSFGGSFSTAISSASTAPSSSSGGSSGGGGGSSGGGGGGGGGGGW